MNGSVSSVTLGLSAALRLARGRADGVVLVPADRAFVARSFWSIAFCVPLVVCRLLMSWVDTGVPADAAHEIGSELIIFVLGWLIFVEATYRIAPLLGLAERWGRFIALLNWCSVIECTLVVIGGIPGMLGAPPLIDQTCALVAFGWALWLEWYATRLALGVGPLVAIGAVVLDQSIAIILASVAIGLSG